MLGITAVRLGLHIIPPHKLLPFGKCPSGFTGHGARLASNAAIEIKNKGKLPLGMCFRVRVIHVSIDLPVEHLIHESLPAGRHIMMASWMIVFTYSSPFCCQA